MKRIINILTKTLIYAVIAIICFFLLSFYALQLPEVQSRIADRATEWLGNELGGSITFSNIEVKWFDEVKIEDLNIKDNRDRNMIYVRELFVNAKTNFTVGLKEAFSYDKAVGIRSLKFKPEKIIRFDNNLDFVTLKDPVAHLIRDSLNNLNIDYWIEEIDRLTTPKDWTPGKPATPFSIDNAQIQNGLISITTENTQPHNDGTFDFGNFEFKDLNARLEKLHFVRDTVTLVSKGLQAKDNFSNLVLKNVTGKFYHSKKQMKLDDFVARINNSVLQDRLHMDYSKPGDFQDFFAKVHLDGDFKNSVLNTQDIAMFIPFMGQFNEDYKINTLLNGTVDNLELKKLNMEFGKGSRIQADARMKGLPDLLTVYSDIDFEPSVLLEEDVAQYSRNLAFQKYIKKIGRLELSGKYTGLYNDFEVKPRLYSPLLGEIVGEVSLNVKNGLEYTGNLLINKFRVGELLDIESLNEITFNGKINGTGQTLDEAKVHLDGYVSDIDFKEYKYKNIRVDGDLSQSLFEGNVKIDDPNLLADLNGRVDFRADKNQFNFDGLLGFANLKPLGVSKKDYQIRSSIDFNFNGNKLDDWLGEAGFYGFQLREDDKVLKVDSMYFYSDLNASERVFEIKSGFFDADLKGDFVPSVLLNDILDLVHEHKMYFVNTESEREKYYADKISSSQYNTVPYHSSFTVKFNEPKPLFDFFTPGIYISKGTRLSGNYTEGLHHSFHISAETDTISIQSNDFYKSSLDYYVEKETLSPTIINRLSAKSGIQKTGNNSYSEELFINANWEGTNTIDFRTFVTQLSSKSLIDLRGKLNFYKDGFNINILPDQSKIQLLDMNWSFASNNNMDFKSKNITFTNVGIRGENQQEISLNGKMSQNQDDLLELSVNAFKIENLMPFINQDLGGLATGNLVLKNYFLDPVFFSNLHVENFRYKKSMVGTVTSSGVWDDDKDRMNIDIEVFKDLEEILSMKGYFDAKEEKDKLNLDGVLANASLNMFMGMTGDVFSKLEGKANGKFKVRGRPGKPVFNGKIAITDGSLQVAVSGTELYFSDNILLTDRGFELPVAGVIGRDAPNGNEAILTGGVYYKDSPGWDIHVNAQIDNKSGFKILNIKNFANDYLFGTAYTTGNVQLSGDFDDLLISGDLTSKEGTHIVIPTDGDTKLSQENQGIVFLKPKRIEEEDPYGYLSRRAEEKSGEIRLAFNLTLTPEADGELIFDRVNNDILSVYGDGNLSVVYDSRGEFTVTGPYNVHGGKYFFSFQNLASLRRFNISDNSRIVFNGDPFEAKIDITATYTTNIGIGKISPQLSNSSARFPATVTVNLSDRLLTPTITYGIGFDLKQIPISGQADVMAFEQRLNNDEQLLGRNVSSILVFNDVSPDNNIAEAVSQQFLIENISSLLSNQIGNLANKLDPNLEFGLRFGDFRENLLNNMQLDFSYKLLNNRIKLSGKGAFINSLEDNISNMTPNTYGQLSVGGEIEYLISDDGAYKFKLYSRSVPTNYYVFYSQGNVIVSGGNLIISKNFNSFFKNRKTNGVGVGGNG